MPQLKTLDAAIRKAPDPDQLSSLAIGAAAIVDGTSPDYQLLKTLLAERIQAIPRFTQVLRKSPFDGAQEWIEHPSFDLQKHLRRVVVPRPGDDAALFQAIAYALERPLDMDLPLWECWVIEGLKNNQWAILLKIHHCVADGTSAAHILTRLCDDRDNGDGGDMFANNFAHKQYSSAKGEQRSWTDMLWRASAIAGGINSALTGMAWPAPKSSSRVDTIRRRYSTVRVPIADVDRVCRKFGVTANDVALAAITEGYRTVLLGRGEEPRADSLRTVMPASVRVMLPYLPVEHEDSVTRLRTVHRRTNTKVSAQGPGRIVESAMNFLPPPLREQAFQLINRLPQHGIVTLATTVSGPRHQLRLLGKPLDRVLPIPPTALRLSTGVAVLSYDDEMVFGFTADYAAARDIDQLADGIQREMGRLVALSQDSVLLFTRDRRRRKTPAGAHRRRFATPTERVRR